MKNGKILMLFVFAIAINYFSEISNAKKLLAHYMPWYQSQPYRGSWGLHWNGGQIPNTQTTYFNPPNTFASHYTPLFGLYDSSDPQLLASQALLMKFAGIDGIIVDWYGIANFWDYGLLRDSTNAFIPYVKKADLEFSICYEDQSVKYMKQEHYLADQAAAVAHGQQVMQWLQTNYFSDPCYARIDNRPILLCFGPQFFTDSEWSTLFSVLNPKPHFFPLQWPGIPVSYPTRTGEFSWPLLQSGSTTTSPTPSSKIVNDITNFYSRSNTYHWEHYLDEAFPKFHDIYALEGYSSLGYISPSYAAFGNTYSYTLQRSLQSSSDIVQLITWNDYGEGTIIEPTVEDGYTYLEITQQKRKQYVDPDFQYTADDLRLPVRLYNLRKANLNSAPKLALLNIAEDDLFADDFKDAEKIFDQIQCNTLLQGDLDFDCRVDIDDIQILSMAWLSNSENENWNPVCDISQPADSIINFGDFAVLAENWLIIAQ
jgi:hypothetical protein